MTWVETLLAFEGIIGALLGVVVTLIVTHTLKNAGHIKVEITKQNIKYFAMDEAGFREEAESLSDAETVNFDIDIDIKNKSESRKAINNIIVKLLDSDKKVIKEITPKDTDTERFVAAQHIYSEITYLNCDSKDFLKKNLQLYVTVEELVDSKYLVLEYLQVDKKLFPKRSRKILINK